jgi:hypothetical protein
MMGKKTLKEIKAELADLLAKLPGGDPDAWFEKEIRAARGSANRDVETLEILRRALKQGRKKRRPAARRKTIHK